MMHRMLYIEEILDHIFSHIDIEQGETLIHELRTPKSFVIALSSTCKAFKEPALNILWERLPDLTPLVRCLPEGSWVNSEGVYAFNRQLEQTDWHTILGYSRRVRALPYLRDSGGVALDTLQVLSKPPSSMFPRLREVGIDDRWKNLGVSAFMQQLINPRLTDLCLETTENLESILDTLGKGSPNVRSFRSREGVNHDAVSSLICSWENLHRVDCRLVELNAAALAHLSGAHNLVDLRFRLHDELAHCIQSSQSLTMTFPALHTLSLFSSSLAWDSRLLYHLCLPVINDLSVHPGTIPAVPDLMSFLATLQEICPRDTLHHFSLVLGDYEFTVDYVPPYNIIVDHLYPLTVFVNIRSISIDIICGVDLSERDLLSLASSWPHLEEFSVLDYKHWTSSSYITPEGFLQLLGRCKSLTKLHFKFDIRGYTEIPQGHPWRGLSMPQHACLGLQTSLIEEEAIYAFAVFLHVAPFPHFHLSTYWGDRYLLDGETPREVRGLYRDRWIKVEKLARRLWEERTNLKRELMARFPTII